MDIRSVDQRDRQTDRQYPGLTSRGRSEHIWTGVGHDLKNIQAFIHGDKHTTTHFNTGKKFFRYVL